VNIIERTVHRIDERQQRTRYVAFPFAVMKKFGDDQAGNLAALIAYYGFFSIFPLLLVFVTGLGIVLRGNPSLQHSITQSALRNFPVIGTQISKGIHSITGNGVVLGIGVAGTLWGGLGVTMAAQNAMNTLWGVPRKDWPNFLWSRIRGLLLLAILGTITVAATLASGFGTSGGGGAWWKWPAGVAVSLVLNLALFMLSFRVLTAKDVSWRDVFPGSAFAAILWTILQMVGGYYVTHQLKGASNVYGTFAIVIGLLVWIYLGAQITLYGAEINVVRKLHLWPRSLAQPPLSDADKRTYEHTARVEQRRPEEEVSVAFDAKADEGPKDSAVTEAEPKDHDESTAVAKERREAS
jgi:YihY family inner membrane protein